MTNDDNSTRAGAFDPSHVYIQETTPPVTRVIVAEQMDAALSVSLSIARVPAHSRAPRADDENASLALYTI